MLDKLVASILGKSTQEPLAAVDIGTSTIKVMELDLTGERPRLISAGSAPTPASAISNNVITKPNEVAAVIRGIFEANDVKTRKVVTCIPGPAAFSKKITMGTMEPKELATNIQFEASNYIPHSVSAVHLDYQVLRRDESSTMEVLLVAVKNEVVDSYLTTFQLADLELTIVDIDFYALENMFEVNYPEEREKVIALVNVGARYTSVNILEDGVSVFTGDVGVGGRLYTDALVETLGMQPLQAEQTKITGKTEAYDSNLVTETMDRTHEHVASELHRQLGFFWNAASTDRPIDAIYLCGGGAQVNGLLEELSEKTGIACTAVESLRKVDGLDSFDRDYINELAPALGVSVGLALRMSGDKYQMSAK